VKSCWPAPDARLPSIGVAGFESLEQGLNRMNDHTPLYVSRLQAIRRDTKEGWYDVDSEGNFCFGPFATCDACVAHITRRAR
jgi:hypothetical protein